MIECLVNEECLLQCLLLCDQFEAAIPAFRVRIRTSKISPPSSPLVFAGQEVSTNHKGERFFVTSSELRRVEAINTENIALLLEYISVCVQGQT